jgi:alpha-mannosidase
VSSRRFADSVVSCAALVKRGNRKSELLLREVEYVATMASLRDHHYTYPKKVRAHAVFDLESNPLTTA